MDATTYDVFCDWLQKQQDAEIIFVQEIHWGLGKTESSWRIGSWHAFVSPDPRHRYAGVAIFVSSKVAEANQVAYHSIIPGRILHVRCVKPRVTLDLIAGYQHVWQAGKKDVVTKQRHTFWNKLGKLLHDLPVRNLLLMGMDLNSGIKPLPGLIGRGVMHTTRHADTELEAMLQVHHLVLLNTWSQASPVRCHTFFNNGNRTQLDFIMTRRLTTDAIARLSRPMLLDLTPWRQGPKHRPVQASVPWVAGWTKVKRPTSERRCDVRLLRQAAAQHGSEAQALQHLFKSAIACSPDPPSLDAVNQHILKQCTVLYPSKPKASARPGETPKVRSCIADMWRQHHLLKSYGAKLGRNNIHQAWRQHSEFKAGVRSLQKASRQARRDRLECLIQQAEQAAQKHCQSELYRVINIIAPKKRYDKVRIRSPEGQVLSQKQEFEAIYKYFSQAFSRQDSYAAVPLPVLDFTQAEIREAIMQLKNNKAVPPNSLPAEMWKLCPEECAAWLSAILERSTAANTLPPEVADCTLSLLPKPGRTTRLPKDLRPLGLQDPSSKIVAIVLRTRLRDWTTCRNLHTARKRPSIRQ